MNILSSNYIISSPSVANCPIADKPEYAFIGRSNVGKSSLINMLTNKKNLAKTSANPGKTKLINHFIIESSHPISTIKTEKKLWYLVDLPGYGFAKISQQQRKQWEKMIGEYLRNRLNLVMTFVLIDARHKPQFIDLDFIDDLGKWKVPFALVFTKTDKIKQAEVTINVNAFLKAMQQNWEGMPDYFITSAITKIGNDKILDYIQQLNAGFIKNIS